MSEKQANSVLEMPLKKLTTLERNQIKNDIKDLTFQTVNEKIFPIIRIKRRSNEYPSTSIIINASNEILVDLFLQKKIPFLGISKTIMRILDDRNYKKYAIRKPKNINEIVEIDNWARNKTLKILDQKFLVQIKTPITGHQEFRLLCTCKIL